MSDLRTPANLHDSTKKPNFLLIVILSAVLILVFFVVAYMFLHRDAKDVDPHRPNQEPNSRLILPEPAADAAQTV